MTENYKARIVRAITNYGLKQAVKENTMQKQTYTKTTGKSQSRTAPTASRETYSVSTPVEYEQNGEKKTFWQSLGRAFETEKGIMVRLNAVPTNGTMFLSKFVDTETEKQ